MRSAHRIANDELERALKRVQQLEQQMSEIRTGEVVVMPSSIKHAEAMHLVADAYLKTHRKS